MLRNRNKSIIISYYTLRRLIGILGILLPFICIFGGLAADIKIQGSVSAYYHSNMRELFTGLMSCMGVFLLTYKGREFIDNIVSSAAGLSALGIMIFPCSTMTVPSGTLLGMFQLPMKISDTIHLIFAISFFVICALNSIFLFTLSSKKREDIEAPKKIRNRIYRVSGIIILLSLLILGILKITIPAEEFDSRRLVLIFEIIMLASFGAAWIIKGNTLFKDSLKTKERALKL